MMKNCKPANFDDPLQENAGATDCADVFIDRMNCLYLLAFLATADRQIAEKCFSQALDEYVETRGGFLEWAKLDGRRAILRHAIRTLRPVPKHAYSWSCHRHAQPLVSTAHQAFATITSLNAFERFVFVMSVIEGFSVEECAALLDSSIQDVALGRELAGSIIAAEDAGCDLTSEMDLFLMPSLLSHQRCGIC